MPDGLRKRRPPTWFPIRAASKWVVKQIGGGETISHLAAELDCCWDTVNAAVRIYGAALLAADTKRLKETTAIGLDESLFVRAGPFKHKTWSTLRRGQPRPHRRAPDQGLHPGGAVAPSPAPPREREPRLRLPRHVEDLCRGVSGRHPQGDAGRRAVPH